MPYSLAKLNPAFLKGYKSKSSKIKSNLFWVFVVFSTVILYLYVGYCFGEAWDYYKLPSTQSFD